MFLFVLMQETKLRKNYTI